MDINDLINPVNRIRTPQPRDDNEIAETLLFLSRQRYYRHPPAEDRKENEVSAAAVLTSEAREITPPREIRTNPELTHHSRITVPTRFEIQAFPPGLTPRRPVRAGTELSPRSRILDQAARANKNSSPPGRISTQSARLATQESTLARGSMQQTHTEATSSPEARVPTQPARGDTYESPPAQPRPYAQTTPPSRVPLQATRLDTHSTPPSRVPAQAARPSTQTTPSSRVPAQPADLETDSSLARALARSSRPWMQVTPPRVATQQPRPEGQSSSPTGVVMQPALPDTEAASSDGPPTPPVRPEESSPPARTHAQAAEQRPRPEITIEHTLIPSEQALQAHLIRQQIIAGIPPERITHMRRIRYSGQREIPGLIHITNEGVVIPEIPPAQFRGIFHPLPGSRAPNAETMRSSPRVPERSNSTPERRPAIQRDAQPQTPPMPRPGHGFLPVTPPHRPAPTAPPAHHRCRGSGGRGTRGIITRRDIRARAQIQTQSKPNAKGFNIVEALVKYPEICLEFIGYLGPSGLLTLYSISKNFYIFVNGHYQDAILNVAARWAPESALLYPGRCYPRFCVQLPQTGKLPTGRTYFRTLPQRVPSIRWLHMITYREEATEAILAELEKEGYDLPRRCSLVIKKLWFLMDIRENIRREWTVQNTNIWPDVDLYLAILFIIKLEKFLHETYREKSNPLRRLLLARPSMGLLYNTLCKDALKCDFDIYREYLRWKYMALPFEIDTGLFNIPPPLIGMFQFEGYGRKGRGALFKAPDEIILREAVARNLDMKQIHVDYFFEDERLNFSYRGSKGGEGIKPSWVEDIEKDGRGKNMNRLDVVVID